jgi:hypothetical protein
MIRRGGRLISSISNTSVRIVFISTLRCNWLAFGALYPRHQDSTIDSPLRNERALGSLPASIAGCPTSSSFFARCGIPQACPSSPLRADGSTRVPHVRTSVRGPKTMGEAHQSLSFQT